MPRLTDLDRRGRKFFGAFVGTLLSVGCGSKSGGDRAAAPAVDLPDTPLAGTIDGQPWTFATGVARATGGDSAKVMIELSEATVARSCDAFAWPRDSAERQVALSAAAAPGREDRSEVSGESITIVVRKPGTDTDNRIGFGAIQLDEVTRAEMRGKISVRFDDRNVAMGAFTVRRCSSEFADPSTDFQADAQPDAALVGVWSGSIGRMADWIWTMTFAADGTAIARLKIPADQLLEDADETWQTDSGVMPHRLLRKVSKTRVDTNHFEAEGSTQFCVYGIPAGGTQLLVGCSSTYFPAELPIATDASMVLSKVP